MIVPGLIDVAGLLYTRPDPRFGAARRSGGQRIRLRILMAAACRAYQRNAKHTRNDERVSGNGLTHSIYPFLRIGQFISAMG